MVLKVVLNVKERLYGKLWRGSGGFSFRIGGCACRSVLDDQHNDLRKQLEGIDALVSCCLSRCLRWALPPRWLLSEWREELKAQAYLTLLEALVHYDPSRGVPLEAFLQQRVMGALLTRYRQEWRYACQCRVSLSVLNDIDQEMEGSLSISEEIPIEAIHLGLTLQSAMERISASERQLLLNIFWEGCTESEVALGLGITQRAVNKRKQRALETLRRLLDSLELDDLFG